MAGRALAAAVLLAVAAAVPAAAQQLEARPGFLYLDQERILTESARGRALLAEEEAAREALRSEARAIESAFEAEERDLTERRPAMDAAEFRAVADAFDVRVIEARNQQDARANSLAQEFDQKRRQFYADIGPILVSLMARAGALAIFDETSMLLADQSLDVTDEVIAEIDRAGAAAPPPAGGEGAAPAAGAGPRAPGSE